ncbi:hypothetical protein GP486_006640 [Trichoglossum hirsutum]|uniref:PNPLA domain-containing protein n=1 Tax=Trichoglossum hirsutum TaxID=265104 RepID=A0A9P8IIZ5_9PEZI|nr:hypothetical protein GP486_006640 [Trichoglossum hirsutum]
MAIEQKSLQILTIDGGGYQGIASLLILDALMKAIAGTPGGGQGPNKKPIRPCDVFDVIGGVGSGGSVHLFLSPSRPVANLCMRRWLALLLGRFKLTISECLYEYFNIVNAMTRRKTPSGPSSSPMHRNIYDIDALVRYVEHLTDEYGTGEMLLDSDNQSRCKHTFVVACCKEKEETENGLCVFRTYELPRGYATRLDPAKIRISDAFAAAGAKKGFLYPFKLPSARGSTLKFGEEIIPEYFTSATIYALKEIRQQYGVSGVIPSIINVGPGIPNIESIKRWEKMREKLFWGFYGNKTNPLLATKTLPTTNYTRSPDTIADSQPPPPLPPHEEPSKRTSLVGKFFHHPCFLRDERRIKRSWSILEKIRFSEANAVTCIEDELKSFDAGSKYVRLAPDDGPDLKAGNDLSAKQETRRCTETYLNSDAAKSSMKKFVTKDGPNVVEVG